MCQMHLHNILIDTDYENPQPTNRGGGTPSPDSHLACLQPLNPGLPVL